MEVVAKGGIKPPTCFIPDLRNRPINGDRVRSRGMLVRIFPHRADAENIDVSQKQLLHLVGSFRKNGAHAPKNSPRLDTFRLTSKRRVPRRP